MQKTLKPQENQKPEVQVQQSEDDSLAPNLFKHAKTEQFNQEPYTSESVMKSSLSIQQAPATTADDTDTEYVDEDEYLLTGKFYDTFKHVFQNFKSNVV